MNAGFKNPVLAVCGICLALSFWPFVCGLIADEIVMGPSLRSDVPFSDHQHTHFEVGNGLPSNYIHDLIQTRKGYVWIATNRGIAQFDGQKFRKYDRISADLPSNDVRCLHEDSRGRLWAGTSAGLARFNSVSKQFETVEETAGGVVGAVYEDARSHLWVGVNKNYFRSEDGLKFEKIADGPARILSICEDRRGQLWFGTEFGLYALDESGQLEFLTHEDFPVPKESDGSWIFGKVHALTPSRDGGILVGSRWGLHRLRDGKLTRIENGLKRQGVFDILETRSGDILLAASSGIFRSVGGMPFERILDHTYCHRLLEDSEGGLFVGRLAKLGLEYYQHGVGETVLAKEYVHCVFEDKEKNIWVGTRDNGLFRYDRDGMAKQYGPPEGLPDWRVYSIAKGLGSTFLVATRKGIVRWNGEQFQTDGLPQEVANMHVVNCIESSAGDIYFSIATGQTYVVRNGKLSVLSALERRPANWFAELDPEQIWIGTDSGIFEHHKGQTAKVDGPANAGVTSSHFVSNHVARDGSIWLATASGIAVYRSGKFVAINSKHGIVDEFVDRLAVDSKGNVWLGGPNGLSLIDHPQWDGWDESNEENQVDCRAYGSYVFAASRFGPKTCLASDGTIWIASNPGVLKIRPDRKGNPIPPVPVIERIYLNGLLSGEQSGMHFESGKNRLSIEFGAISFSDPKNVRIRYRLNGYDENWTEAGQQRSADFTDLSPGLYQFEVMANNSDGVPARAQLDFAFRVTPRWFETLGFRVLAGFMIVAFSIGSTLIFSRSVRKRNRVLRKEIEDRKVAEKRLRQSEERFRDLAESTHAVPFEANSEGFQFVFVGDQVVDLLGYPVNEWKAHDFWMQCVFADDRSAAVKKIQQAMAKGGSHQFDCRMVSNDGTIKWIHHVLHFTDSGDSTQRVIGFMIDFTEQKAAEQKAADYLAQLERVNRAASLGEMASSIAHEVNQPLFAIVSNAETTKRLLEKSTPDIGEVKDALEDIVEDGNRASSIIRNIRSHVTQESRELKSVNLNDVVNQAARLILPELHRRNLELKVDLFPQDIHVSGNSIELEQVILNLLLNAAQAMKTSNERCLTTQTLCEKDAALVRVVDRGTGIDDAVLPNLFEPFFTTKQKGTGMGLAINKTIIEAHQGKIWATNNDSQGATFHFSLPCLHEVSE